MKNEKGYALILVLIIITVTTILGLSLSSLAVSARYQFNNTDTRNRATDLAEMGVTYYEHVVNNELTKVINQFNQLPSGQQNKYDRDTYIRSNLDTQLNSKYPQVQVESNYFQITYTSTVLSSDHTAMTVTFQSTGTTGGTSVQVTGSFLIRKGPLSSSISGQPKPMPSSYSVTEQNLVNLINQPKFANYNSSTYFSNNVTIQGNRILTVNGNACFNYLSLQGSAKIKILGDAIFEKPIDTTGNAYSICVTGRTYIVDSNTSKLNDYSIVNSCSSSGKTDWWLDVNNGISVTY